MVTLFFENLIYPFGELQRTLFPDGDIIDNVTTWLEEAAGNSVVDGLVDADSNQAARYWVNYRAYSAAALRIALLPSSEQRTDVSTSWGQGRIDFFTQKANENKAAFDAMVNDAADIGAIGALFTVAPARTAVCHG